MSEPAFKRRKLSLSRKLQLLGGPEWHCQWPFQTEQLQGNLRELIYNELMDRGNHFFPETLAMSPITFNLPLSHQQGKIDDEYGEAARGRPCGHIFSADETVYRCRDCGVDSTCVMCTQCYRSSDHEGHDIIISINGGHGGCCDCGDAEAWKTEMKCAIHHSKVKLEKREPPVDKALSEHFRTIVVAMLDFVLNVFEHAKESVAPPTELSVSLDAKASALVGEHYAPEPPASSFATVLWNDEKHSFDEVIDIVKRSCKKTVAFGREVANTVDKLGRAVIYSGDLTEAVRIAEALGRIRLGVTVRASRDIVREQISHLLIEMLLDLANLAVFVGDERNTQIFRTIICEELIKDWQIGVAKGAQIGSMGEALQDDPTDEDDEDEDDRDNENGLETEIEFDDIEQATNNLLEEIALLEPEEQAEVLGLTNASRARRGPMQQNSLVQSALENAQEGRETFCPPHWRNHQAQVRIQKSRLAKLFLIDLRLWKCARLSVRELYVTTMVSIPQFKRQMGITFATIYKTLAEIYLFADRDPDSSMIIFSVQLFTVPSISECLVKEHEFFTTLLAALYTYFTTKKIGNANQVDIQSLIVSEVFSFRSRRHYHLINDLRYLLQTKGIQQAMPDLTDVQEQFFDFIALFQGMNPQKQILGEHVEYEPDTWINAFNVIMQIAKHAQLFAKTFHWANDKGKVAAAINSLHKRLGDWALGRNADRMPLYEPAVNENSFHHPLHWLFAGLVAQLGEPFRPDDLKLSDHIISFVLRTINWTWEIRAGFWVRNGHSLRAQLHHYTDVNFREYCFDRDIHCIQWWLASMPVPEDGFARTQCLDKRVSKMMSGFPKVCPAGELPSDDGELQMLELMAHFLIIIFQERTWIHARDESADLLRTLRQALVFGPRSFSEISKLFTDIDDDHQYIEDTLKLLADYRAPSGLEDTGKFVLREEEFSKIDPYFYRNSRSQVDEVKEFLAKKGYDIFLPDFEVDNSAWNSLQNFALTRNLQTYLVNYFKKLRKASANEAAILEGVTDKFLQLVLLMLHENVVREWRYINPRLFQENWSIFKFLTKAKLIAHPLFKAHHRKLQRISQLLGEAQYGCPLSDAESADDKPVKSPEEVEFARKRALAKARQEKLLRDMKASQNAFMDLNEMVEDESEDDMQAENAWYFPKGNCLVCQQDLTAFRTYGLLACVHETRLDRLTPAPGGPAGTQFQQPLKVKEMNEWIPVNTHQETFGKDSITTCGHLMHWECYHSFYENIKSRHLRYMQLGRNVTARIEFRCPLCQTVGNIFLPIMAESRPMTASLSNTAKGNWLIDDLGQAGDELAKGITLGILKERYAELKAQKHDKNAVIASTPQPGSYQQYMTAIRTFGTHLPEGASSFSLNSSADLAHKMFVFTATITDVEIALRGRTHNDNKDTPVVTLIEGLSENNILSLRAQCSLIEKYLALGYYQLDASAESTTAEGNDYSGNVRSRLNQIYSSIFLAQGSETTAFELGGLIPIMARDIFSVLVEVAMLLHPTDFCFSEILKVLFSVELYKVIVFNQSHGITTEPCLLAEYALAFLRKASILANTVLGLEFPTVQEQGITELESLCKILGVTFPVGSTQELSEKGMLQGWYKHFECFRRSDARKGISLQVSHPRPFTMAPLPKALDTMLEHCQKFVCPNCKTTPPQPALCMFCGNFVCFQSHCCWNDQLLAGECTTHRAQCGGSIGIYFIPKRCTMLITRHDIGSFGPAPYLDVHGETDPDMKRGKPQYLNERRYDMGIVQLYTQHQIPTWLVKKLDMSSTDMGIGGWTTL